MHERRIVLRLKEEEVRMNELEDGDKFRFKNDDEYVSSREIHTVVGEPYIDIKQPGHVWCGISTVMTK